LIKKRVRETEMAIKAIHVNWPPTYISHNRCNISDNVRHSQDVCLLLVVFYIAKQALHSLAS